MVVTGGSGFLGRAIVEHLVGRGHEVVALVRSEAASAELAGAGLLTRRFDLGDPRSVAEAARGADALVHAAGTSDPRASALALGWLHVAGTENVLRGARHAGVRRFVHLSCADVTLTGEPRANWSEDRTTIGLPIDALARTKREAEESVLGAGTGSFHTVVLRPAFVWGPRDRTNLPRLCREGLAGGIETVGRGLSFLATTYVGNLASAVEGALLAEAARGGVYYVVDREMALQKPFFDRLSMALGLPPSRVGRALLVERGLARLRSAFGRDGLTEGEVVRRGTSSAFDVKRARTELGYEPPFSQEDGMEALASWARSIGGPEAIAKTARPSPTDADVDELVRRAHED